jgi:hypothetical protein
MDRRSGALDRTGLRALVGSLDFDAARPTASSVKASILVASASRRRNCFRGGRTLVTPAGFEPAISTLKGSRLALC